MLTDGALDYSTIITIEWYDGCELWCGMKGFYPVSLFLRKETVLSVATEDCQTLLQNKQEKCVSVRKMFYTKFIECNRYVIYITCCSDVTRNLSLNRINIYERRKNT